MKSISGWLQWISISLVFVSGGLQVAKYLVDRREKYLQADTQRIKEEEQKSREVALSTTVSSLKTDLASRQAEIAELSKRTAHIDPAQQPIRVGTATVEVIIRSGESVNSQFMDRGGYIAFGRGSEAVMVMAASQCLGRQLGGDRVQYRGIFNLDATDSSIGKPAAFLNDSQFIQVSFIPMPEYSQVLSGSAICTINNTIRFEILIPEQKAQKEKVIVQIAQKLIESAPPAK